MPAAAASDWFGQAVADGYDPVTTAAFGLVANVVTFQDFELQKTSATYCFSDTFDTDTGWVASAAVNTVQWHRRKNSDVLVNSAIPGCVVLPPDESCTPDPANWNDPCAICAAASSTACIPQAGALPRAVAGQYAAWFGSEQMGNYLGAGGVCEKGSGGVSQAASIGGTYTSPQIPIAKDAENVRVVFWYWYEVESVHVGAGYDIMSVSVSSNGNKWLPIGTLAPELPVSGAQDHSWSSSGYNKAPKWALANMALPPDVKTIIQGTGKMFVRFTFESTDGAFNGFRGWLVDIVRVVGNGCGG